MKTHFKTIVLSDLHLGTGGSKVKELVSFLKLHSCDTLILNGDIIDGWQLKKYGIWKKKHTRFIRTVMKMMEDHKTKVIYTRGNHDDFLDQFIPMKLGKRFFIQREYIFESFGKKYLVTHGDIFDAITTNMKWLSHLGDVGYTFLLWLNKIYNQYRTRKGLPYYSLSQVIKAKVKTAVSYISDYEGELVQYAKSKGCDAVICGHIHQPAIKEMDGVLYLNSGDWVESLSALVEDFDGKWHLVYYTETLGQMGKNRHLFPENEDLEEEDFMEEELLQFVESR